MSKHDSAPTHGWVISSYINKWLAGLFIAWLLIVTIAIVIVRHQVTRDCNDLYTRDVKLFSYWLHVEVGRDIDGCPYYDA